MTVKVIMSDTKNPRWCWGQRGSDFHKQFEIVRHEVLIRDPPLVATFAFDRLASYMIGQFTKLGFCSPLVTIRANKLCKSFPAFNQICSTVIN